MYCDVTQLQDSSAEPADILWYPLSDDARTGLCKSPVTVGTDATLTQVGGVVTTYVHAAGDSQYVGLAPGGCDDLGLAAPPALPTTLQGPSGQAFTAPASAVSVAQAVQSSGAPAFYGVVTFATAYAAASATGAGFNGFYFLQDSVVGSAPAQPGSGALVFIPKTAAADLGLPATPPKRGDIVEIQGTTFSLYQGVPQFTYVAGTSALSVLGQGPLPTAVSLPGSGLAPSKSSSPYAGLRAVNTDSWSETNACSQPN